MGSNASIPQYVVVGAANGTNPRRELRNASYIKGCEIRCRDELYDMIQIFVREQDHQLYDEDERKRFIKEIIDFPDENVLDRYVCFLQYCLSGSKKLR